MARAGQRDGGAVHREDVGIVLAVGREDEGDDLRLVVEALGEERPDGPVDQARGQDLLLRRAAFALEPAAGDPPAGVGVLAVVDGEGEEVGVLLGLLVEDGGRQHDGVAVPNDRGAVGLLGELADFDVEGFRAPMGIEIWCFMTVVPCKSVEAAKRECPPPVGRTRPGCGPSPCARRRPDYLRSPRRSMSLW